MLDDLFHPVDSATLGRTESLFFGLAGGRADLGLFDHFLLFLDHPITAGAEPDPLETFVVKSLLEASRLFGRLVWYRHDADKSADLCFSHSRIEDETLDAQPLAFLE